MFCRHGYPALLKNIGEGVGVQGKASPRVCEKRLVHDVGQYPNCLVRSLFLSFFTLISSVVLFFSFDSLRCACVCCVAYSCRSFSFLLFCTAFWVTSSSSFISWGSKKEKRERAYLPDNTISALSNLTDELIFSIDNELLVQHGE